MVKVKKLYYFVELDNGTERVISEREYNRKVKEYETLSWDKDEFSRDFINKSLFIQYENCITFYLNDTSITLGYGQREYHK